MINRYKTMNLRQIYVRGIVSIVCFFGCAGIVLAKDTVEKKYSAVAQRSVDFGVGASPQKINFKFDGGSAWLRENGTFQVEAEVKHESLLCGTYEIGIRFGIGSPACTNVSWLSKTRFISKRKQCNHAWMVHQGTDTETGIVDDMDIISCAQLVVKCTGKCK
jgi:hypothetical protein